MADSTQEQNNLSIEDELEEYLKAGGPQQQPVVGRSAPTPAVPMEDERDPIMQGDLLSQIAAEDQKEEENKKKPRKTISFSKVFSIFMMRMTLLIDEIQHKYAMPIKMLELFWCVFIFIIYIGGIASLIILIYVYFSYPRYISTYFKDNNIELSSWDMGSYTLSRIELSNLKSKDGAYSIKKVVIRSGFSDFLRGRIKTVSLEGTVIKVKEKGDKLEWGSLTELLLKLNQPSSNQYKIGSISIPNAVLNVEGTAYKLPINLSINGVYENKPNVSIPLSIKQKHMNISALLSMSGSGKNLEWTLDNLSGNLSFPNRQPENIAGKFKIRTNGMSVSAIDGNLNLTYGKNRKRIKVDLQKNKDLFRGTIGLSLNNQEVRDKADETKTEMQMVFEGLDIKHPSRISSNEPIRVNVQSFNSHDISLSNVAGVMRGNLNCLNFVCKYEIKSNVPVSIQNTRFASQGNTYFSTERTLFTLLPTKKTNMIFDGDHIQLDMKMQNMSYAGNKNKNDEIKTSAKEMDIKGKLSFLNQQSNLEIKANGVDYSSNSTVLQKADIVVADILNKEMDFSLLSPSVLLKHNRLIKVPFAVNINRTQGMAQASLSMLNNKVQMRYVGAANFRTGAFVGKFAVLPFDLKSSSENLHNISDIFPNTIQNVSGELALYGDINWKNEKQVSGPFYLMAKNVGFKVGNIDVKELNAGMVVQSLVPFVTPNRQDIYIGRVDSVLPFRNVNATLKFDNQLVHISQLNAQVAGVTMGLDNPGLMQYRRSSTILSLKATDVDLSPMNKYWKIAGLSLTGKGSLTIPLELKDNDLRLVGGEVKLTNVDMKYTGKDSKIRNALFRNSNDYMLRFGSIRLTQLPDNKLSAYLNFEGRMLPDQIKSTYTDSIAIDLNTLLNETAPAPVPQEIQQRQQAIEGLFKNQK